jgi:aminotransferase
VLTDEIYEHIVYDAEHVPPATVPGLEDRTVTINALSKTYAVTGWRVGLGDRAGGDHEQHPQGARLPHRRRRRPAAGGGRRAMALPPSYYTDSAAAYRERRDLLCRCSRGGFAFRVPDGAYYVLCATGSLDPAQDSSAYARRIVRDRASPPSRHVVLRRPEGRRGPDPLRVPEAARDAARRRRAHRGAAR